MVVGLVLGHVVLVDVGDELAAPLRLPAGEVRIRRVVVEEGRVVDLVEVGLSRLPVASITDIRDVLRSAIAHGEWPGADRFRIVFTDRITDLRPDVFRDDRLLPGDVIKVRHGRRLKRHHDLVRPLLLDVRKDGPERLQIQGTVRLDQVEGIDDVLGRERLAVAPLDAGTDGEGQRLVVRAPFVGAGQQRRLLAIQQIDVDQRLIDRAEGQKVDIAIERVEPAGPQRPALVVDGERPALGRRGFRCRRIAARANQQQREKRNPSCRRHGLISEDVRSVRLQPDRFCA